MNPREDATPNPGLCLDEECQTLPLLVEQACEDRELGREVAVSLLQSDGKATAFGTGVNIANNIIGAGMLSLPYVLREASVFWGVVIIATVCAAAALSFYMLAACCQLSGHADYRRIGAAAFGPAMGRAIQGTVLCYTAAACVSFIVLLGDLLPAVVLKLTDGVGPLGHLLGSRATAVPILGATVLLPMSCVRDLRHFQHSSAFALTCDFLAAYIIISHFLTASAPTPSLSPPTLPLAAHVAPSVNWATPGLSALTTMPIVVVAANAHYNAPRYYVELRGRSTARLGAIIAAALSLCVVVYISVGVSGYLEYGDATRGDMFNSYPAIDTAATLGRAALSIHLAMTFPLIFNALRHSVHVLFFGQPGSGDMSVQRAISYTLAIVPPLVAIGTAIPEISTVFAFNGSLFGSLIVYIYPALIYMKLSDIHQPQGFLWGRLLPCAIAAFGVFLMVTGATVTALQKAGAL